MDVRNVSGVIDSGLPLSERQRMELRLRHAQEDVAEAYDRWKYEREELKRIRKELKKLKRGKEWNG